MKKWIAPLAGVMAVLLAITPVSAAEKLDEAVELPGLTVLSQRSIEAVQNGYQWTYTDPSGQEGLSATWSEENREPMSVPAGEIPWLEIDPSTPRALLSFSQMPTSYQVRRWDYSQPDAEAATVSLSENLFSLQDGGPFLYEVEAVWPQGTIRYLFGAYLGSYTTPDPPLLTVSMGERKLDTLLNSYTWTYTDEDGEKRISEAGVPPLQTVALPLLEQNGGIAVLEFSGEIAPKSVSVVRWEIGQRGLSGEVAGTVVPLSGMELALPSYGGYIYQVTAEWSAGTSTYLFETTPMRPVTAYTVKSSYQPDSNNIMLKITNRSGEPVTYDTQYELHRYENGKWYIVPGKGDAAGWSATVMPGQTVSCSQTVTENGEQLKEGYYRFAKKTVGDSGKEYLVYAYFRLGLPRDGIRLGAPSQITFVVQNNLGGRAQAQLTRIGRYEGVSPLGFMLRELQKFEQASDNATFLGDTAEAGLYLTVSYAGTNLEDVQLYIDPNMTVYTDGEYRTVCGFRHNGQTYIADPEVYESMLACGQYVMENIAVQQKP